MVTWVKRKKPDAKKAPHIKKDSKPLAKAKPTRAPAGGIVFLAGLLARSEKLM